MTVPEEDFSADSARTSANTAVLSYIYKNVAKQSTKGKYEFRTTAELSPHIVNELYRNNYLISHDGVWTYIEWNEKGAVLPERQSMYYAYILLSVASAVFLGLHIVSAILCILTAVAFGMYVFVLPLMGWEWTATVYVLAVTSPITVPFVLITAGILLICLFIAAIAPK